MKDSQWKLRWIRLGDDACGDGQLPVLAQPYPPREESDVAELASSVRLHGVLEPIVLREVPGGLEIICGHRRYRAAVAAGVDRIPAIITRMGDAEAIRSYLSQKLVRGPFSVEAREKALEILRQLRSEESASETRSEESAGETGVDAVDTVVASAAPDADQTVASPIETSRQDAVLKLDRMSRAAEAIIPAPESPRSRRSAENLLKRVESIFNEALVRRSLPTERVESVVDTIIDMGESDRNLDWRFLVPRTGETDPTAAHSLLVATTCDRVARYLGYDAREARELVTAGLLHDIGMIFVRQAASRNTKRVAASDNDFLRSHTRIGCAVIESTGTWSEEVANAARDHHERCNGSGYPAGKRGTELTLTARLLGILDSYCAMMSPRPYRAALSPSAAWSRLGKSTEAGLYDERLFQQLAGLFWQPGPATTLAEAPKKVARTCETSLEKTPELATMPLEGSR